MFKHLENLHELVSSRNFNDALPVAINIWEQVPCPELSQIINEITTRLTLHKSDAPEPEALLSNPDVLWFDVAIQWLHKVSGSPAMKRNLERLVEVWPDDPRIIDYIMDFISCPAWDLSEGNPARLAESMIRILANSRDERIEPWIKDLPGLFESRRGTRKGQLSRDEIHSLEELFNSAGLVPGKGRENPLPTAPFILNAQETDMLANVMSLLDGMRADQQRKAAEKAKLLQAVADNWESDEPKLVYSDYLLERGDPQGEFIALSLHSERDKKTTARLKKLESQVRTQIGVPAYEWKKGFPRKVQLWGFEGATGFYDTIHEWCTVESVDVPPVSDDCHTENLRHLQVSVGYLKDLTKLSKPLGVSEFCIINASTRSRGPLKKIKVLGSVETLELRQPDCRDTYDWLLSISWLKNLKTLVFSAIGTYDLQFLTQATTPFFALSPALQSVKYITYERNDKPLIELERKTGNDCLVILHIENESVASSLLEVFADSPRPCFDYLEIRSPIDNPPLQDLGHHTTVTTTFAEPATFKIEAGWLVVTPGEGEKFLDITSLRTALQKHNKPAAKIKLNDVNFEWLQGYLNICNEICDAKTEIEFYGLYRYYLHTIRRLTDGRFEIRMNEYSFPEEMFSPLDSPRFILRCSPGMDLKDISKRFTQHGWETEAIHDYDVMLDLYHTKYVKSPKRLDFKASRFVYGILAMPTPETATHLVERYRESLPDKNRNKLIIKEIRFELAKPRFGENFKDWLEWFEQQSCPTSFRNFNRHTSIFTPAEGRLRASLFLDHLDDDSRWAKRLRTINDKRFQELTVISFEEIPEPVVKQIARIADKYELVVE